MLEVACHLRRGLHPHFTAEGIVTDCFPDTVIAVNHLPHTAEVVGDIVVPTGRTAVVVQIHIAAVELPHQRLAFAQDQTVNVHVRRGSPRIAIPILYGHHMAT